MQDDLDAAYPGLNIDIIGVNAAGHESANSLMTSGRNRPWLQDVDTNANGLSDLWDDSWDIEYRDVVILDGENVQVGVYNLTVNSLGTAANYSTLREMMVDAAMKVQKPWHNKTKPVDVTGDGLVVPQDALFVINSLTADGSRELPPPTTATFGAPYYDTDGDNFIAPIDALLVVNHLNLFGAGEGEAELAAVTDLAAPIRLVSAGAADWSALDWSALDSSLLDSSSPGVATRRSAVAEPHLSAMTETAIIGTDWLTIRSDIADIADIDALEDLGKRGDTEHDGQLANDSDAFDDLITCLAQDIAAR